MSLLCVVEGGGIGGGIGGELFDQIPLPLLGRLLRVLHS